jgi:phosphatidylglycerol lysyltransferase
VINSVIKSLNCARRHHWVEVWSVWTAAILTAFMGVINILSTVTPALTDRFRILDQFLPLIVRRSGRLSASLAGFALLLLAGKLKQRKRVAWLLTIVVLIISAVSHIIKGLDYEEAILALSLAAWLLTAYSHFHAHSDPPSVKQGLKIVFLALFFTLTYGVTGFYLLDRHFSVNFGFWQAVQQTIIMFTEFYDPGLQPITGFGRFFADSIYFVGASTMGYALLMLVRPVFIYHPVDNTDREHAQSIVEEYGRTPLARYTLLDDKLYFFSNYGTVIAYVVKGRIALALGDPIGPADDCLKAILEFIKYCNINDWQVSFYQTLPDYLEFYQSTGFGTLCIGHEAIVNLNKFTLEGKAGKALRTPMNRLNRCGFYAQMHKPPLDDALIHQLENISDEWLTSMHSTEKRFSLGWFNYEYIRHSHVMTIMAADGTPTAFANIIPEYQKNEVTIDLMRRQQYAESGTMEYMFVSLFQWAKENGYGTFNLGLSALAGVGTGANDPIVEKALFYIYEHLNQFYNFKGLHEFKTKFQPAWEPRYLIYPGPASLPSVITALVKADSGDDFLWRFIRKRRK